MLALKQKKYLAVQIGRNALTVIVYTKAKSKLTVYHTGQIPLRKGIIYDGEITQMDVVSSLISRYLQDNGIVVKDVVFSIYHSRIMTREVDLPVLPPAKMKKLIEANVQDYFPVDVTGYAVSHKIRETVVEKDIKKAKVLILAVPEKIINQYVGLCEILDLNMMGIDYQENSVFHFAQLQSLTGTHMLMHIDYESTTVVIQQSERCAFIKTLPLGVSHFRQAIKDQYRLSEDEALKRLYKEKVLSPDERPYEIADIGEEENYLQKTIDHMLRTVEGYVKYYNSKDGATPIQNVYVTGLGGNVCEMTQYIESSLGITTQKLSVFKGMTYQFQDPTQKPVEGIEVALGTTFFDFNVLPKQVREVRQKKERSRFAKLVIVLVIVSCMSVVVAPVLQLILLENQHQVLEREIAHYEYIESFKVIYDKEQEAYANRMYVVERGNTKGNTLLSFIEELEQKMPSNVIIEAAASTEEGMELQVQAGSRLLAARFLTVLKETGRFTTVYTNGLSNTSQSEQIDLFNTPSAPSSEQADDETVTFAVTCTY